MVIQERAPTTASAAAMAKDVVQPKRWATQGVSEAVTAPPTWAPMLTMLEKTPELRPAMSAGDRPEGALRDVKRTGTACQDHARELGALDPRAQHQENSGYQERYRG